MEAELPHQTATARSRRLVRAATAVMAGLVLAGAAAIWQLRQGAIADAQEETHRLGVVIAEQATRTLQAVDFVLQDFTEKVLLSGVIDLPSLYDTLGGRETYEALTKRLVDLPQAEAFTIVDATGHIVNVTRQWPAPAYSLADRDYLRYFAATADNHAYVSEPAISRSSGAQTIFLARRLTAASGAFLGVVVAPIRIEYFDGFFARTGFSDGTGVTMLRRDGVVLERFPALGVGPGARMPPSSRWFETVAAGGGTYRSDGSFTDHRPSFVSVHPLTTYPIVVDVIRTEEAALARWWRQALALGAAVFAAALTLILLLRSLSGQITLIERSQHRIAQQVATIEAREESLAAQSALLEATLGNMSQGLMVVDGDGFVAVCNRQAMAMLDLPAGMIAARPPFSQLVQYSIDQGEFTDDHGTPFDPALILNENAKYERRRRNGTVLEARTAPLPTGGWVRTYTDITARATAEQMLGHAASHDTMTGCANRAGFSARLNAALVAAQRNEAGLAVLCLDLDRFKAVNDTLGHTAGDELLMAVAQRMRDCARGGDVIGRLGGDEFAVILSGSDLDGAGTAATRMLEVIRQPYNLNGEIAHIGASIGIAIYPTDGATAEKLLNNADTALYKAKAEGRNTWCAYATEDGEREYSRTLLERDFRTAVETQALNLAYQPICEAATSVPVGFEALLRWNNPRTGSVSPADFIPVAEQTGLIIPLGRWVIEAACAEAATWAMPLHIAVNLSPAQFRDQSLVDFIRDVLARTGLAPSRLDLEVTEGLLLENGEDVVNTMNALRGMGIRMVLDDFGTAHSNLSYLRGFPFDVVKIDRSFLRALSTDRQARALVEAILAMARALGLDVVGEGVETQEQLALLCHLECRWVQGYLLGRPATTADTRDLIWKLAASNARNEKVLVALPRAAGT